jgi:hypothetical protein
MPLKMEKVRNDALRLAPKVSLGVYVSAMFNTTGVKTDFSTDPDSYKYRENFNPDKRNLGFIMALKVDGAKAKQITDSYGITLDFINEGAGKATGELEQQNATFPTPGKSMTAIFLTRGNYDLLSEKDKIEAIARLRYNIWKRYLEFALAATYAQILPELYTYAGKPYSINSFYARQVKRDTSHISFHHFMKSEEFEAAYSEPWSKSAVKEKMQNEVFDRAKELWSLSKDGGRLVFQKSFNGKEYPPEQSKLSGYSGIAGVDLQNGLIVPPPPGEPVSKWLLALNDAEQKEFMSVLSDLFGNYKDASGNVLQGSNTLAKDISGEVSRISPDSRRVTTEEVKLAELLFDAASYNKEIIIVKVVTTGAGGSFSISPVGYYDDSKKETYPFKAFDNCTMIAFNSKILGKGGKKTIGGKNLEERNLDAFPGYQRSSDWDEFKGPWWVFVHELIHANPLYANEYYDNPNKQKEYLEYWAKQGVNLDPDDVTWKFLYRDMPIPVTNVKRKDWPEVWNPTF